MRSKAGIRQQPLFLLLEGIDGSGKSTVASILHDTLQSRGIASAVYSEPTRGKYGKEIRTLLGSRKPDNTILLELFIQDRLEDIAKNITPSLENGSIVILDRYYYSNAAYQANSMDESDAIADRNRSYGMPEPDRIYYLQLSPKEAMDRIMTRLENTGRECFDNQDRLEAIAARYDHILPTGTVRIDARNSPESIVEEILSDIEAFQEREQHG
ncbi:MAG: dTMP kinase [Spirochaetota bacterium]